MTRSKLREEYVDVGENMRHYGNMRFAQLTLFVGITAGFMSVIFADPKPPDYLNMITSIGGIVVTIAFWLIEERVALFFHNYRSRAVQLEKILGYRQHTTRPEGKFITAANAVRLLFLGTVAFWIAQLWLRNCLLQ